jgi:hypothetical protein
MTNNEIISARFNDILEALKRENPDMENLFEGHAATACAGCEGLFYLKETDFDFWKLGPPDFCPNCWK